MPLPRRERHSCRSASGGVALGVWKKIARVINLCSTAMGYLSAGMIVFSSCILIYEVLMRYYFARPTSWVIETCIFLLVGSTFLAAAFTQMSYGHISIDILAAMLPKRVEVWRALIVDTVTFLFCLFVAAICWRQFGYAWKGGWAYPTMLAPKMWIPYSLMSIGMTLLCIQQLVQLLEQRYQAVVERED